MLQANPGPGEYASPAPPSGPAYTMRPRPPSPERPPSPGPADYQRPAGPTGPAYTIKGRCAGRRSADRLPLRMPVRPTADIQSVLCTPWLVTCLSHACLTHAHT